MPKGGSRVRSGPAKDPTSARSERAARAASSTTATAAEDAVTTSAFNPTALPARGRAGNPPAFPLPKKGSSGTAADSFRKRELAIWREVWKTPQAVAWEREPYRWPTVAEFCRLKAIVESESSNAAMFARLREYRNEIGLSPDGLKANGWAIAPDELAAKRAERTTKPAEEKPAPVRRLRGGPQ